ncbi:NAD(P)H-hydrate dehydratase [Ekhidna sp.]|uniref:NAD(P)H-hydrate dehydratase n=1 Tax=Ekhidna sp. TaxID=2608089 RepID=UPI00329980CF
MKVLSSEQIRKADQFTIKNEPISSIDLMERASQAFVTKFLGLHPEKKSVYVFSGTGNNGGDGLAIARMIIERGWEVKVYVVGEEKKGSPDFKTNLYLLPSFELIQDQHNFPAIAPDSIILDGLFGSGLSRPLTGVYGDLVKFLNEQNAERIAIDISSGLYADQPIPDELVAFESHYTISFQSPKLAFFLPESEKYVGQWRVVDIGLDKSFIEAQSSNYRLSEVNEIRDLMPARSTFTHKNKVGRLLVVAGSIGKMGAAVLCARAAFKAGAGLINMHVPACGIDIAQISLPEAMVSVDGGQNFIEAIPETNDIVAIGPGLGTNKETVEALRLFLRSHKKPVVFDADALNILSENKDFLKEIPEESIFTPHPGEFKRLVGEWENDFEKLEKLREICLVHKLNIVLKGAFSAVCNSGGKVYFNPTGNPGLATAGSGDVLTGIVGAFLAQGLVPFDALRLAVYLHGLAGDEAVRKLQTPWIQASEIIDHIPTAVRSLLND